MSMIARAKLQATPEVMQLMKGGSCTRDTFAKIAGVISQYPPIAPMEAFDEGSAGPPPEFSQLESWIAHPRRGAGVRAVDDANHLSCAGAALPLVECRPCDCFFVVDSCYGTEGHAFRGHTMAEQWNLPLNAEGFTERQLSAKVVEQMEMRVAAGASCFNRTCRVYAPKYRQIHVGAFAHLPALARLTDDPAARSGPARPRELGQAIDLAYGDIRRAFLHFVSDPETAERPFILAGHSQGVIHLVRLLQEEVEDHPERCARFVHAYLTGFSVPMDLFSRSLRRVRPSTSASDVCSVSSWRTAAVGHLSPRFLRSAAFYAGEGWQDTQDREMLTNNPITWCQGPERSASDAEAFCGAVWPLPMNLDDPRAEEGRLISSGTGLRFGRRSHRSRGILGAEVHALVRVDCGAVTAQVDSKNVLRVPHVPKRSLFSITERDFLLYHDLDFALFHNNLQMNVATRVRAWQANEKMVASVNSSHERILSKMVEKGA
mmetsp:Transcript_94621/g.237374  ORF Transcript_94621/g.237374 Transcript_94621/m.237374 type:complete len:489 (-) Transcript_94621:171-1637(-)